MAILPITGCLFYIIPFYVMYLVLECAVSNTIVCIFMFIESARVERRKSEEKDKILVTMSSRSCTNFLYFKHNMRNVV